MDNENRSTDSAVTVTVRFYEELNDFLAKKDIKKDITVSYKGKRSVKDLIESLGVPHVEIDLIIANGSSVDFGYQVMNGDRISVYPVFESFDISEVTKLRKLPLRESSFVLDVHLRKLARYLRLLGFNVEYDPNRDDPELAMISKETGRILLTRDRQLLMRRVVDRGLYIKNIHPITQTREVLHRLDLYNSCKSFTRCAECNAFLKELIYDRPDFNEKKSNIPPGELDWCESFHICIDCGKIYWSGSHMSKLKSVIARLTDQNAEI